MKVSVVMATYNGAEYIVEQLDSIRNQSVRADEVLIYDDQSLDNTYEIIRGYIEQYNLLNDWKVIKNDTNKGWRKNFIDGINESTGDVIFLSDQDDIWETDKIEKMKSIMESSSGINVLASNFDAFYDGVGTDKALTGHQLDRYGKEELVKVKLDKLWLEPWRPGCCICFRSSVKPMLNKIWFEECAHDLLLWAIGISTDSAYIYNQVLIHQRRHIGTSTPSNSKTSANRSNLMKIYFTLAERVLDVELLDIKDSSKQFIKRMLDFYKERYYMMKYKKASKVFKLGLQLSLYPKPSSYAADIYTLLH